MSLSSAFAPVVNATSKVSNMSNFFFIIFLVKLINKTYFCRKDNTFM